MTKKAEAHPALDDPRAQATEDQNRIDLNDPTLSGVEAVSKNLGYAVEPSAEPVEG